MVNPPRRRVLAAAATGSALSLAGCSALDDDEPTADTDEADAPDDTDEADAPDGEAAATVAVDIDERMQEERADIQRRLEEEEIDEEEAQAELQETQLEVLEETIGEFEAHVADVDGLAVADTSVQTGLVLVEGDAAAMVDALDSEPVAALVPADAFEAV